MSSKVNHEKLNSTNRMKRSANKKSGFVPDGEFWKLWRENKEAMKEAGYQPRKTHNGWYVYVSNDAYKIDLNFSREHKR